MIASLASSAKHPILNVSAILVTYMYCMQLYNKFLHPHLLQCFFLNLENNLHVRYKPYPYSIIHCMMYNIGHLPEL